MPVWVSRVVRDSVELEIAGQNNHLIKCHETGGQWWYIESASFIPAESWELHLRNPNEPQERASVRVDIVEQSYSEPSFVNQPL